MNERELYLNLNVDCKEDILRIFPNRYESLKQTPIELNPVDGKRYVFVGIPYKISSPKISKVSLIRFRIRYFDNRELSCMIINQSFYLQKLASKKDLLFVAYYTDSRKAFVISSITEPDNYFALSGIKPCYALPKSISPSYFTNYIKKILAYPTLGLCKASLIPPLYQKKYQLIDHFQAYQAVHMPRNEEHLKQGLRVFKYEEALSYCIKALKIKKLNDSRKKKNTLSISHKEVNNFVRGLSFKLTSDQLNSIREIVLDMEKDRVMYRLLQGDVGTGKTIVAFVALYANYLRGKQGVMMAPTFELASQHYEKCKKVFEKYNLNIAFLAGDNIKGKEKTNLLNQLKDGGINILIATHAAISSSVVFKDLGLTIVDEQQLFGVEQREALINKGNSSDLLMMSATPIPRTLSQIINSDVDVSTLEQFPSGVRNVKTEVIRSTDPILDQAIKKAMAANRQIFIVAPKIEDSGRNNSASAIKLFDEIKEKYGEDNCQLLHGRIKKETRDEIYQRFLNGEKLILVSTTVIEVGIDVSKAALLIVYDANYFGLSSLHQLRGRIGRSGDFALALLVYDGNDKDASDKLKFLAENNDGLKISQYDLKMRGAGSYSGDRQSGKSELTVCNFVEDLNVFMTAKSDAIEILNNPTEASNAKYLASIEIEKDLHIV